MSAIPKEKPAPEPPRRLPPLQNGDRLTRDEFERRYEAMPHLKKAELIDGVVYMPSPVSMKYHGNPHFNTIHWLGAYAALTPGVLGGDNSTVRLDMENEPQPDACLIIVAPSLAQARIGDDGYIEGAPDLAAEVAATSANYDLHVKLNAYRRNGVREYVVWRVFDGEIDWFVLRNGNYERLVASADGIRQSETFPGLWLDAAALMKGDMARVTEVVRQGCATPEHAAFIARLQEVS
jgi:Uma2 family endonuclease